MKSASMSEPATCPICKKAMNTAVSAKYLPFCSDRCRKVDLMRWWDGRYQIVEPLSHDALMNLDSDVDPDAFIDEDVSESS
jgi:endogenous inhibitor of DNA gyrase (YacG/DUF329 family)